MTKETKDWFTSWFDTPYYHILYKDRNYDEAQNFMENLTCYLNIPENGKILDLACGKGRHSVYLNAIGYNVTGVDLSPYSIASAKQFENETLHFDVHNMSQPYSQQFDAVFNLFTSFGYFESEEDNLNTIKAIKANLKNNGIGVIDFMNVDFVIENLIPKNTKTVEGIEFNLKRYVEKDYIIKDISFKVDNITYNYKESVKAITLDDFKDMFQKANIQLLDIFGDYKLHPFDKKTSERLILIFK
ncbi:MAG: class I SAM-dependent methyltransferase [Flavobacteriaceae bacterium]|nr:class I SAM-dependent methyltransferase [Flavobacteriaceae bacterium]